MGVFASFLMGLEMLRRNKLRAFLTMLGVIIGVMSVTLIVMISGGFQAFIKGEFDKVGSRSIFIFFDPGRRGQGETTGSTEGLTLDDVALIAQRVPTLGEIVPEADYGSMRATLGDRKMDDAKVVASAPGYFAIKGTKLVAGRSLNAEDDSESRNVAVVGEEVASKLGGISCIGKQIELPGITVEVVGISKADSTLGQSSGKDVIIPIQTSIAKWKGGRTVNIIIARPRADADLQATMDSIWRVLMEKSGNRPYYRVDSSESIVKVFGAILGGAGAVLAGIAALSLLVGGIGIMNIMLVSVTERTREIGLRKALGAKRGAVLTQFLVEAGTLSLVGGLIGMSLAYVLGLIVTIGTAAAKFPHEGGLTTPFPIAAAAMATLFSAGIGILFGLYPALSASRLDPIVALRRE